eukprot:206651-Amorphochlora_amoeboformis.AAC.2
MGEGVGKFSGEEGDMRLRTRVKVAAKGLKLTIYSIGSRSANRLPPQTIGWDNRRTYGTRHPSLRGVTVPAEPPQIGCRFKRGGLLRPSRRNVSTSET